MKRLFFGIAVLIVIGLIVGIGTYTVDKTDKRMNEIFEQIETAAKNDEFSSAVKLCEKAEKEWINHEEKLSFFVNHQEVCDIGVAISAMKPMIEHKEKAEFFSELNKAKTQLTHLSKMENINNNWIFKRFSWLFYYLVLKLD